MSELETLDPRLKPGAYIHNAWGEKRGELFLVKGVLPGATARALTGVELENAWTEKIVVLDVAHVRQFYTLALPAPEVPDVVPV